MSTTSGSGGSSAAGDSGETFAPGNPSSACTSGVPSRGQLVDTSKPTTVVGSGSPASCTFSALSAAVSQGGIITFDCGGNPTTITVTSTLNLPTTTSTVIDGGGTITLDGGGAVELLSFDSGNWQVNTNGLTLQRLTLAHGKTTPTDAIPPAPAPCSQGWDDGEGGAVFVRDGSLTVIDSIFEGNQAALLGPDTGGGAIYVEGSKGGVLIAGSTFTGNQGANGGAIGTLWAELDVYSSVFSNNVATGNGANNNDPSECSAMNNGQNEVGSGGNGGALYNDGENANVILCGDTITNNDAGSGAFGGGLFFTSDNFSGTLTITDTTMTGNTGGHWTTVQSGSVTNAGTAVGVNALSITVTSSTLQGL
ncbi:MAG TPA: hypothetical protein VEK07_14640 [Polyangiaceae bacterium]|nr:hypothetical protein [Polyangiaceae bacterium]